MLNRAAARAALSDLWVSNVPFLWETVDRGGLGDTKEAAEREKTDSNGEHFVPAADNDHKNEAKSDKVGRRNVLKGKNVISKVSTGLRQELKGLDPQTIEKIKSLSQAIVEGKKLLSTLKSDTEKTTLRTNQARQLLEFYLLQHEDITSTQHRSLAAEQKDEAASVRSLEEVETALKTIRSAQLDLEIRHKEASTDLQLVQQNHSEKNRRCTAALRLVSQTVEALKELHGYTRRLEDVRRNVELERRCLFNQYQELRGNLRVFCRIRPLLPHERTAAEDATPLLRVSKDKTTLAVSSGNQGASGFSTARITGKPSGGNSSNERQINVFTFDRVFDQDATQRDIFTEVDNLVQSALDGFNVAMFAYGQTGSGKTYTMNGRIVSSGLGPESGVIPRSFKLLFDSISELARQGWKYTTKIAVLEIYNETLRDLLNGFDLRRSFQCTNEDAEDRSCVGVTERHSQQCDIRLDPKGNVIVTNLTYLPVQNVTEVFAALEFANRQRSVAATMCNAQSSRSHSVVQLTITREPIGEADATVVRVIRSTLSLVDLAGSERLEKSQATGDRLKEAQAINKSLSSLGEVINAISLRRVHVPFRNSKLTLLLKDSLGGNAKTLMLVNISPAKISRMETLFSLRFAAKAQICQLNHR